MKNIFALFLGLAVLMGGSQAANAQGRQRQRGGNFSYGGYGAGGYGTTGAADPRTVTDWPNSRYGTNGFDIIEINNIFNPNRVYTRPRTNGPPPPPFYSFTLNGALTYGANDTGYAFFYGSAGVRNTGYTTSETINGFKISEITNNTVTLVDTNNATYTLKVGSGFSKTGTNQWKFLPVPDASNYVTSDSGSTEATSSDGSPDDLSNLPPGPTSDAMARLIARRKAEMEASSGPSAPADAPPDSNSTSNTNSTPASPNGNNNP